MALKTLHGILTFLSIFFFTSVSAQVQIGSDVDGEAAGDGFGGAVAISADGSRIVVGATSNTGNGLASGHARAYEFNGTEWEQLGMDIDGVAESDRSGFSVGMSDDGNRIAIGAPFNDANGNSSGQVRVYDWTDNNWTQTGADINGWVADELSGWTLVLSDDGNRLAVAAIQSSAGEYESGQVRIYEFNGGNWTLLGNPINGENIGDGSGESLSFSSGGARVAIGAIHNGDNGYNSGHARVFEYNGVSWVQVGADIDGEAQYDRSGKSVSLSNDGNRIAIGAHQNTNSTGGTAGHVRVFEYNGSSWVQLGTDMEGNNGGGQRFGWASSISGNGNRIAIGAFLSDNENGGDAGNVQIYEFENGDWNQVFSNMYGEAANDQSGISVALSDDGEHVVIGANYNDGNGMDAGHARVYELTNCTHTTSIDIIETCESHTWIDGNTYNSSNNSATYTLPNAEGCDSIITLNLTINNSTSSKIIESACDEFILNGEVYTSSGTYSQMTINEVGCDSLITLELTITTLDTSITPMDNQLNADENNATYQWIDCDNNQAIEGATGQTFIPSQSGSYAVELTSNGCMATSDCYNIIPSSIKENGFSHPISLFPNPVDDKAYIDMGQMYSGITVEVLDLAGKLVRYENIDNASDFSIDIRQVSTGSYFLKLIAEEHQAVFLLIKK